MAYDNDNVFAKILRGKIPSDKVLENDFVLAFRDINAARPVHVLVIPKGKYTDVGDFVANASQAEIVGFWKSVAETADAIGVTAAGYRIIANTGVNGGQEVPHFHVHMLGGARVGPMVSG